MAKYYYEFPFDSKEGRALAKFHHACVNAERMAEKYAKGMGAVSYYTSPHYFTGGVEYLVFADPQKVNTDIWRLANKTKDGEQWWEPNVEKVAGCVKARENFTPSDVAGRTYSKRPSTWDEVRRTYTLDEWLAFIGFKTSGDKEIDSKAIVGLLGDKQFYKYIDIIPNAAPVAGRKRSRDGSKAVTAEQERMKLPVVRTEDFYQIVHAHNVAAENEKEGKPLKVDESTPVFFAHAGKWNIGLDRLIDCGDYDGFAEITAGMFTARKNFMLRELNRK